MDAAEVQAHEEHNNHAIGLLVVAVVALIIAAVLVYSSETTGQYLKSVLSPAAAGGAKQQDSGGGKSVWETLKELGVRGEHYTLNIHGKNDSFKKTDCTVEPDPITGSYSNNIFIPSNGDSTDNNQLIMTSGNAKGKWAATSPVYGVRDACTAPFDGDAAELTLPPNPNGKGYYVVARVLGKPTENPELSISGDLMFVKDEIGNDLLVLGLVTDNGFETTSQTLTRTKGKVDAVDITGVFEWSGQVCYFDGTNYCYDDAQNYLCADMSRCCADTTGDGMVDTCVDPTIGTDGTLSCTIGTLTTLACMDYVNEWVFNIGDLVGYLWDLDAQGDFKPANIRFYPVP